MEQKEFVINGEEFSDLKGFYDCIGKLLVEKNDWGKNWNAFNDILRGGFVKTESGEPIKLIWQNSKISESKLNDYKDIIDLIKEYEHIELRRE